MEIGIQYILPLLLLGVLAVEFKWARWVYAIVVAIGVIVPVAYLIYKHWSVFSVVFFIGFFVDIVPAFFNKSGKTLFQIFIDKL